MRHQHGSENREKLKRGGPCFGFPRVDVICWSCACPFKFDVIVDFWPPELFSHVYLTYAIHGRMNETDGGVLTPASVDLSVPSFSGSLSSNPCGNSSDFASKFF